MRSLKRAHVCDQVRYLLVCKPVDSVGRHGTGALAQYGPEGGILGELLLELGGVQGGRESPRSGLAVTRGALLQGEDGLSARGISR